jgi:hypothetical protein
MMNGVICLLLISLAGMMVFEAIRKSKTLEQPQSI